MEARLRSQDFWAGLAFILFSLCGYWFGRKLNVGTPSDMGAGFFPRMLSIALGIIGVIVMAKGLLGKSEEVEQIHLRPFLVLVAFVSFALLLPILGLIAAIPAMTVVGSLARREAMRPVEIVILSAALTAFAWFVFVVLFSMPMRLLGS